tara:strand:+ start:2230 stop:2445 length:216 start_codon:yes stop_codon:yes gene_type:complete
MQTPAKVRVAKVPLRAQLNALQVNPTPCVFSVPGWVVHVVRMFVQRHIIQGEKSGLRSAKKARASATNTPI